MGNVLSREIMDDWKRLQDKIRENINREEIRRIIKEQYSLDIGDDEIEVRQGRTIEHEEQQALELDLRIYHSFSVLIDENGNYAISEETEQESPMTPEQRIEQTGQEAGESALRFES